VVALREVETMPHLGHLGGLPASCIAPGPYGAIALVGARLLDRYSRATDDSTRILRALAEDNFADRATGGPTTA
jgi:hypothetical protein